MNVFHMDKLVVNILWAAVAVAALMLLSDYVSPSEKTVRAKHLRRVLAGDPTLPKPEPEAIFALPPLAVFADTNRVVPADKINIILFKDGTLKWSQRKEDAGAEKKQR